jgi:hypothetical protein
MNRNKSTFDFGAVITGNIQRSKFRRRSQHKTTFNAGDLVPIYIDEVLPGDSFKMGTSMVVRESTLLAPVMDNSYVDTYYFYVPSRILWNKFKEFNGENTNSAWVDADDYTIPQVKGLLKNVPEGSLWDYFGIPNNPNAADDAVIEVSALPFRAYQLIWNEWFRDQNVQAPLLIDRGSDTVDCGDFKWDLNDVNISKYITLQKVNKYNDYFTQCLPAPQKGDAVTFGLGERADLKVGSEYDLQKDDGSDFFLFNHPVTTGSTPFGHFETKKNGPDNWFNSFQLGAGKDHDGPATFKTTLYADLSDATATSVNDIRLAFQLQKMLERDARGGTRYTEIVQNHFGVQSPDARQQRPEYLGGAHIPIEVHQVVQTSATGDTGATGDTAAMSLTSDFRGSFSKSFTEHGYIIGVAAVRTEHTYQQGIERFWSRKDRTDFYLPVFANIGEQPVLNKEIYVTGTPTDDEVFGYQEAWADYRYKPSRVSGEFRSTRDDSLDVWHYADVYTDLPTLSQDWMYETKANIDRTIVVQSTATHQFIADFAFDLEVVRPLPVFSTPGLIDHN